MKSDFFLLIFLLGTLVLTAQPATTVPDNTYGTGGTKSTTTTDNGLGIRTTTEEYYDGSKPPKLRKKTIITKNLIEGDSTVHSIHYYDGYAEEKYQEYQTKYDATGNTIYIEAKEYHNNGDVKIIIKITFLRDGMILIEETDKNGYKKKLLGQNIDAPNEYKNYCAVPKATILAGYSYLNGSSGNDRVGFPLGAHLNLIYNLRSNIGIGVDASIHRKKEGDIILSRSFIMIDGKYALGDVKDCNKNWTGDIHVLIGVGTDRTKFSSDSYSNTSKESGPAFGAGAGLILRLNKKIQPAVQGDFITAKWADKWNNHFRLSAGLIVILGRSKPISDNSDEY